MIPIWELEKKSDAHLGNGDSYLGTYNKIYDWDTNSLLCFLLKNFVYCAQSLTDLTVMLFSEYLSVSHIDHRDAPHSTFFHLNGQSVF